MAHDADMDLAQRAAQGDSEAIAALEAGVFARARDHLLARGFARWVVDEAMQQARIALLVADDGAPGIARYAGTGPLGAFVRVVAARFALKVTPAANAPQAEQQILDQLDSGAVSPELAALKSTYGAAVREAILAAWRALPAHERFVLSLELHGRMTIQGIAELYGVHKVSAARKLARSRSVLLDEVRTQLRSRIGASPETVDSVLRLVSFPISPSELAPATGVVPQT